MRAAVRRLEFDLLRFLRYEAESDGLFEPEHLELSFGRDGEEPVEIAEGVRVRGQDRPRRRLGRLRARARLQERQAADSYKVASWEQKNRLQAALYMLVAEKLLGLEPVGGVYVPLGGSERRPRGMVAPRSSELGSGFFDNDRLGAEEFEERLDGRAARSPRPPRACARAGSAARPDTCAWNGGCSYPSICRTEA